MLIVFVIKIHLADLMSQLLFFRTISSNIVLINFLLKCYMITLSSYHEIHCLPFNAYLSNYHIQRPEENLDYKSYNYETFLTPLDFQNALLMPEKIPSDEDLKAMHLPDFFEGDIVGFAFNENIQHDVGDIFKYPQNSALNLVTFPDKLWPKGRVPYLLENLLNEFERSVIAQAFEEYRIKTCIKFVPKEEYDYDYVFIKKNRNGGCSSFVGRAGGNQTVSLEIDKCFSKGIVAHELMHVLGFFHEHSRLDRDKYIQVVDDNISPDMLRNFEKYTHKIMDTMDMPYDYGSVMHYHKLAFSKNGKPTIVPYDTNAEIGQRYKLSDIDAAKVNKLYKCNEITPENFVTTTTEIASIVYQKKEVYKGSEEIDKDRDRLLSKSTCVDFNDHCKMWAEIGHCKWSEKYMAHYCKNSCDLCNKETVVTKSPLTNCDDRNLFCPYWAKIGECHNETKFMRQFCQRSCRMC